MSEQQVIAVDQENIKMVSDAENANKRLFVAM